MLGDRQCRQSHAPARARRLVHRTEHQRGAVQDTRLFQFQPQLVALARSLADAGKDRCAPIVRLGRADQFHDQNGLTDAGATEHRRPAAVGQRRQKIDHLDSGLEDAPAPVLQPEGRRLAMDRLARHLGPEAGAAIDRHTQDIDHSPQHGRARRNKDRGARIADRKAAAQPGGFLHGDAPDSVAAQMLLDLGHNMAGAVPRDFQGVVDRRQPVWWEAHIDDRTADAHRDSRTKGRSVGRAVGVRIGCLCLGHCGCPLWRRRCRIIGRRVMPRT